jgi:hypothetical protein
MIVQLSRVIIGGSGNIGNHPRYLLNEAEQVKEQTGSTGLQQVNIQFEGADITALAGTGDNGALLGMNHLAVLPCPPFCSDDKKGEVQNLLTFNGILQNLE